MRYLSAPGIKLVCALLIFLLTKTAVSYVALSGFSALFLDAEFSKNTVVELFYAPSEKAGFRGKYKKKSKQIKAGKRSRSRILLNNHVARKIRLDFGSRPGTVKVYSIELASHFGPGIVFDHRRVFEQFTPNNAITGYRLEKDHVLITYSSGDPYLVLKTTLIQQNGFLAYGLPAALSLIFYLMISRLTWRSLPAIRDIESKQSSSGINIGSLDGIRGIAALLVFAQHCGLGGTGGIFGVLLFFCLSGFLLATPFVRRPDLAASGEYMAHYLVRRVKRIVPMYYVMISILFLFEGRIETAIRHYLFIQADGHLWSIPQEMFFYLLLPPIMMINLLVCRGNRFASTLFLAFAVFLCYRFLTVDLISLYGNNADLRPMAGIFITGAAVSFFYSALVQKYSDFLSKPAIRFCASSTGLLILGTCLVLCTLQGEAYRHFNPLYNPLLFGIAAGLLILATLLSRDSFLDRLMNLVPLRAVGVVGFSFYLLHYLMIESVRNATIYFTAYRPEHLPLFIMAGVATYLVSVLTYSYIERPFIGTKPSR